MIENKKTEEIEEIVETINSEDYQSVLEEEQEAFENGLVIEDEPNIEMDEEEISKQTKEFLKLRAKRKK